jgi:hypothetical protein
MKLPVFDLVSQEYIPGYVVTLRNTPLQKLYPDVEFAIGTVQDLVTAKDPDLKLAAKLLDAGFDGYKLVGASGSRKDGNAIFARHVPGCDDAFTRFFGSNMNAVNYGSNLMTECKVVTEISASILVVEDGEYATGDCHAKCSDRIAEYFNFPSSAAQFRMIATEGLWLAKGTVVVTPNCKYDFIVPVSAFKGNKVKPGEYQTEVVFAIKDISKNTPYCMSYSVVQFLPWEAVEKDILPATVTAAKALNYASAFPNLMLKELAGCKKTECKGFFEVLAKDVAGQLTTHPYIVSKLAEVHQQKWINLALAGAVKFNSGMTQPDETLKDGYCHVPGLPDGEEVIVFSYPCRWKYDIRIWKNVKNIAGWQGIDGILTVNHKTALELGRDFDGDQLAWLPASKLPNIAAAIKAVGLPPKEQPKPKKIPLKGSLGSIAVKSMCNDTGLITWLIAKCYALGMEDAVEQLVPELQAAVDSLKGATPPNKKLLSEISFSIKGESVSWLSQHKKQVTCKANYFTDDDRQDTISKLVREVGRFWKPIEARTTTLTTFLPVANTPDPRWLERAREVCSEYRQELGAIYAKLNGYEIIPIAVQKRHDEMIKSLFARYKAMFAKLSSSQREKAFDAFWAAQHTSNEGVASLSFVCFTDVLAGRLSELRMNRLRLSSKCSSYPDFVFQQHQMHITIKQVDGYYVAYDDNGNIAGGVIVNNSVPVFIDQRILVELSTRYNKQNQPSWVEATVIDGAT